MAEWFIWMVLSAAGAAAQLELDCAAPERARALIEDASLSETKQVEDIHRDLLDKALARCSTGRGGRPVEPSSNGRPISSASAS